jgi:hypothetical protein
VSPAPTSAPARPRFVFYRRSTAIVLSIAHELRNEIDLWSST